MRPRNDASQVRWTAADERDAVGGQRTKSCASGVRIRLTARLLAKESREGIKRCNGVEGEAEFGTLIVLTGGRLSCQRQLTSTGMWSTEPGAPATKVPSPPALGHGYGGEHDGDEHRQLYYPPPAWISSKEKMTEFSEKMGEICQVDTFLPLSLFRRVKCLGCVFA